MKSTRSNVFPFVCSLAVAAMLVVSLTGALLSQTNGQPKKSTVEHIKVHGKSLEGNLEGDSPDRDVFIYLPPGYAANRNQRYPVVYLLHGYGLTAERWMPFTNLQAAADKDIAAGAMKGMILVSPDAFTKYSGSMYSSSVTTGDWETFVAEDLVSYIDSHYRTIPDRMSRGLAGHSMGGYGTVRIGMKRPDVFSSMYIMSACCLMSNPGGQGQGNRGAAPGAGNRGDGNRGAPSAAAPGAPAAATPGAVAPGAATPGAVTPAVANQAAAGNRGDGNRGQAAAGAANGGQGARGQAGGRGGRGGGLGNTQLAQAAAWSPNPKNPPNYSDLPVKDGQPQPLVIAKWQANSPLAMIDQYVTNLKKYYAIMGDVGTEDGLAGQNRQLDQIMTDFGVNHAFETYEGTHTSRVPQRFEEKVLPFFSNNLLFTALKR